ncbi:hypothetical protein [Noviherbaspirillum sp. Root189]|uniref:hypothetical protein n=1 Tax=Noviherbaspirillum sp. Root189 TaxID=1736487 RepID=UPI00070E5700|nr:hypothetical protein [Noviherbaspirillum sp. Root189]KRB91452.1 hypothetical protein ASE07_16480 [Noviherbaspirillum sp. Root189]
MKSNHLTTDITKLFGIRLPFIAGGLMWLANADYVSATANASIIDFITAVSFPDTDELRVETGCCRDLCDGKSFGVNVSILLKLVSGERTREVLVE